MFWHDAGKQGEGQRWIDRILPQMDEGAEPSLPDVCGELPRLTASEVEQSPRAKKQ